MAAKIVDVTIASIRNTGSVGVSPQGRIFGRVVRSIDDEQVFQTELLFNGNGATGISPGQSLTVGAVKRLTVHHFDQESEGQLNQMLVFQTDLIQRHVVLGSVEERPYFGPHSLKVRFDDIAGFQSVSGLYNTVVNHKIEVVYTVNLVASN